MKIVLLLVFIVIVNSSSVENEARRPSSGSCPRRRFLVEPNRRCQRPCEDQEGCRGRRRQCLCDDVCGFSCVLPAAQCPELQNPANGAFSYTSNEAPRYWTSTARYSCNDGFALRGPGIRTCHSDRKWSGEEPSCSDLSVCGQTIRQDATRAKRVVGGVNAEEGVWPWQAAIFLETENVFSTFGGGLHGGGSLINKYWILTVAHLIVELERRSNYLNRTIIGLGYTDLPSRRTRGSATGKLYRPRFTIKHPQFQDSSLFDYDFALIRIGREVTIDEESFRDSNENTDGVTFTDYIRPVCLPCTGTCVTPDEIVSSRGERLLTGNETPEEACAIESAWLTGRRNPRDEVDAFITGFGSTRQQDFGDPASPRLPQTLQQAVITIQSDDQCEDGIQRLNRFQQNRFGSVAIPISYTPQMICAKTNSTEDIDACSGDNGGPLVREIIKTEPGNSCWVQLGITSFGFGCAFRQGDFIYPGYYSDVSKVSSWINNCKTALTDAGRNDHLTCEIDYSECGQAGNLESVSEQATIESEGLNATQQPWPWNVVVSTRDRNGIASYGINHFLGGGSLINNGWVLTSAHLFFTTDRSMEGWEQQILLTFGLQKRPQSPAESLPPHVQFYTADRVVMHPNSTLLFDYDIALIKLGRKYVQSANRILVPTSVAGHVNYIANIRPVCLPCRDNCLSNYLMQRGMLTGDETPEERCQIETNAILETDGDSGDKVLSVAVGFGSLEERMLGERSRPSLSTVLRQKLLRLRESQYCDDFTSLYIPWGPARIPYTDRMLCATSGVVGANIDSCQGDNGGPLMREVAYLEGEEEKRCWVQIGIVSWGWGCRQTLVVNGVADTQVPGYYTNLMVMMSWVNEILASNSD